MVKAAVVKRVTKNHSDGEKISVGEVAEVVVLYCLQQHLSIVTIFIINNISLSCTITCLAPPTGLKEDQGNKNACQVTIGENY